jgi:L-threonylcarbamoyladenylate synthase
MMKTEIVEILDLSSEFEAALKKAADIIRGGGLVVFPTETVYGLGADGTNSTAAKKIYEAKGRPSDNPLIIHISDPEDAEKYVFINETYKRLADAFMPGPLTVVLPSKDIVPLETRASLPTVAVRCPENPIARRLIELSEVPIAAPSANISGSPSPTKACHVIDDMMGRVDMIIDGGDCEFGLESTIVKIEDDGSAILLRPGKITVEQLLEVIPCVTVADAVTSKLNEGETVLSPGMKYRHYAPSSPVFLIDGSEDKFISYICEKTVDKNIAVICYDSYKDKIKTLAPGAYIYSFGDRDDEIKQAHLLFDILRDADKRNFDEIYAPLPPKNGVGLALYNRMIRAAAYQIIRL